MNAPSAAAPAGVGGHRGWPRVSTIVASAAGALALVLTAIALLTSRAGSTQNAGFVLVAPSFAIVGALLAARLPRHPIGWLLVIGGLIAGLGGAAIVLADYGLNVQPGSVPGVIVFAWLGEWAWAPILATVAIFLPLLFPTGHLPSRRWSIVALMGGGVVVIGFILGTFSPWTPDPYPVPNPLALDTSGSAGDLFGVLATVVPLLVVSGCLLAATSLVVRYRRGSQVERQQLKWFAALVAIIGIALLVTGVAQDSTANPGATVHELALLIFTGGIALLPVAIAIAVLRYRLYEIDRLISRTLVYVPLTAILAGLYAASISLFQRLFIATTGNPSDGAIILSTLVLAATFTPIRNAIQLRVDRYFRDTQDAERRLRAFTDSVADGWAEADLARTLRAFLRVVIDAIGASGGAAYVVGDRGDRLVGVTPSRSTPERVVTLGVGGQRLGRLELDPRSSGRPYGADEVAAVQAAADRLAGALGGPADDRVFLEPPTAMPSSATVPGGHGPAPATAQDPRGADPDPWRPAACWAGEARRHPSIPGLPGDGPAPCPGGSRPATVTSVGRRGRT